MRKLAVLLGVALMGVAVLQTSSAWKTEALGQLDEAGVSVAFPDGSFLGEDTLTGYQAAVLMGELLAAVDQATTCPPETEGTLAFNDVPAGHWSTGALTRLSGLGLDEAFPSNTFNGDEFLSGYQTAFLVGRVLEQVSEKVSCGLAGTQQTISALQTQVDDLEAQLGSGGLAGPSVRRDPLDPRVPPARTARTVWQVPPDRPVRTVRTARTVAPPQA